MRENQNKKGYETGKRMLDVILAGAGIVLASPLFLFLTVWIRMDSKGPVFFQQKRVGIHQTHFEILKFRTMRVDTPKDVPTHLMQDAEQYITKSGRFLRKTSLDELPQLINILKGEMSLVGPRPALWNQADLVAERENYGANDVRPGLTGWAQINGRDELPIPKKARWDGWYVRNRGFLVDAICLFGTVVCVVTGQGVKEGKTAIDKKIQ